MTADEVAAIEAGGSIPGVDEDDKENLQETPGGKPKANNVTGSGQKRKANALGGEDASSKKLKGERKTSTSAEEEEEEEEDDEDEAEGDGEQEG